MKSHVDKRFILELGLAFNKEYPYLRIEFTKDGVARTDEPGYAGTPVDPGYEGTANDILRSQAKDMLRNEVGCHDAMTVSEFEAALGTLLACPVQVFRKSNNSWIETKMTRDWTLKQQNDHGRERI